MELGTSLLLADGCQKNYQQFKLASHFGGLLFGVFG